MFEHRVNFVFFVSSGPVLVAQMTEVMKGQKTKVFQNYPVPQREVCKYPLTLNPEMIVA